MVPFVPISDSVSVPYEWKKIFSFETSKISYTTFCLKCLDKWSLTPLIITYSSREWKKKSSFIDLNFFIYKSLLKIKRTDKRETAIRSIWLPFTELIGRLFIDEEEIEPGVVKLCEGRFVVDISVKILGLSKLIQL